MASGSTPASIPAMIPDLRKVLAVNIAGSRPALVASSLRMKADSEAESCLMGLWRENRSGQLHTPQATSTSFPGLEGSDGAAELVGALVEGHLLAVTVEVILVADYRHTECTMVVCSDDCHLVKFGKGCTGYAQSAEHAQHGEEFGV